MNCRACDASLPGEGAACPVCGLLAGGATPEWLRQPEAEAFAQMGEALTEGEPLIGFARGRLVGDVPGQASLSTLVGGSVYANVGLTPGRLVVQPLRVGRRGATPARAVSVEAPAGVRITCEESDVLGVGAVARLVMDFEPGGQARLRTVGRFARLARRLAECVGASGPPSSVAALRCGDCGREQERPARFCPFCGAAQGGEVEQ